MDSSIRLLGVVPYEGMKTLLLRLAEEYPQIRLDVFVGNMEEGVEIARSNLGNRYDAVISRGGTALALRELPLPVVEIELSLYDILYALRLSNGLHSKLAMVAYANVTIGGCFKIDGFRICSGEKGISILTDGFIKEIFNPEYAPERMEDFLSLLLHQPVRIRSVLPNDSARIAGESYLIITDIVIELYDGSIANLEIQRLRTGMNVLFVTASTFSISSANGGMSRSTMSASSLPTSHRREERVPLPSVMPSCLPAMEMSVHGKLYVSRSHAGRCSMSRTSPRLGVGP